MCTFSCSVFLSHGSGGHCHFAVTSRSQVPGPRPMLSAWRSDGRSCPVITDLVSLQQDPHTTFSDSCMVYIGASPTLCPKSEP
jgi:hypothetical protein